jgi:hypothetical protein
MANINWDFISNKEGGSQSVGYVPDGSERSGVTIGTGFDLGQQTEETIKNFGFKDQSILDVVKPYLGLQGAKAKEVAPQLTISDEQKQDVDTSVKSYYENSIINQYNSKKRNVSFEELDPSVQTAIASVGYQYGDLRRTPKFLEAALNNDVEGIVNELRNFDDKFSSRRNAEADYIVNNIKDFGIKKKPLNILDPTAMADGELYIDTLFKTYQSQDLQTKSALEGFGIAANLNMIVPTLIRAFRAPAFEPDPTFSFNDNFSEIRKILDENNIDPAYYDYFVPTVSMPHFLSLIERVKYEQDQRAELQKMGWKGLALDVGSFVLDPVSLLSGVGIVSKITGAGTYLSRVGRLERFTKAGLVIGAEQGALTSIVASESPSIGLNDVLLASAIGGTLGGGISALMRAQFHRVAKDIQAQEFKETGIKITPKGQQFFDDTKTSTIRLKDVVNTSDILDPLTVADKQVIFPFIRNLGVLGLAPISKSTALGTSKSGLAKAFGFNTLEDSIGWVYKGEGRIRDRIVPQADTVENIRINVLTGAFRNIRDVNEAMLGYLKENGFSGTMGALKARVNFTARQQFMQLVSRAIRSQDPKNVNLIDRDLLKNPHIAKAAKFYTDGYKYWRKELIKNGIIKEADFPENIGYLNRKGSFDRYTVLSKKIGHDGVNKLIKEAILSRQPYLDIPKDAELRASLGAKELKFKTPNFNKINEANQADKIARITKLEDDLLLAKQSIEGNKKFAGVVNIDAQGKSVPIKERIKLAKEEIKKIKEEIKKIKEEVKQSKIKLEEDFITPQKAELLAASITNFLRNSHRLGGFDLDALLKIKDATKLKDFLQDSFPNLRADEIDKMSSDLASVVKTITSGRLEERIRLNENFETVINGQKVRIDELYENNVDLLFNEYSQEMAGWVSMAQKLGVRSRDEWYDLQKKLINDIEKSYDLNSFLGKRRADEEIKTIKSVFENLMGRSAEVDPSKIENQVLQNLRRYNFVRVLNQAGVASLPELGTVISANGIKTFIQNIPEFKNIVNEFRTGAPRDNFFKELVTINFGNGDEHLYRLAHGSETLDQNTAATALNRFANSKLLTSAEKITTWASGLTPVDSFLRKLATRTFVDKFADDMYKLKESNFDFNKVNLARYKVLGFTPEELKRFAKEFTDGTVTTEQTFWGTKVKQFNFANWKDQELLETFANRLNRHTRRAVQYNFIGDSQRFFSDNAWGKTMGQFRQFVLTAWSKQFLHNIALADFKTFSMFAYTSMMGTLAYLGQTHFNTIGMGSGQKAEYLDKRLGKSGDYSRLGLAVFQRTGWSSLMPTYMDLVSSQVAPEYRFNTRSSGLEINLITGNPTYDLLSGGANVLGSFLKSMRSDYNFSQVDARRVVRLFAFQNMFGINNTLNLFIDKSGLPEKGSVNLY